MLTDLVFNLLLIPLDVFVVRSVVQARRPRGVFLALAGGLFVALFAAVFFREGFFHLLRLYAFVLFVHVPTVLVAVAIAVAARKRSWRWSLVAAVSALVVISVAIDAFLIEPHRLEINRVEVRSSKIVVPLRVAIVSDLQTDRIGEHERNALAAVVEAKPDLILMPGDFLHVDHEQIPDLSAALAGLMRELEFDAPLGVYAVRGNAEYNDWPAIFTGTPVVPLTESIRLALGPADMTALELWDSFDSNLVVPGSERFHVVFGHAPDFALGEIDADLLIAGHTHGGQVRLPWIGPILTLSQVPRAWAAGVTEFDGGGTLVVSRGVGMERGRAPRLRFLCRPEVVIVDVLPTVDR